MQTLFEKHKQLLENAVQAYKTRGFWMPYSEIPSRAVYGETAKEDGEAAYRALLGNTFELANHPQTTLVGAESSPWGEEMNIRYPSADADTLVAASAASAAALAAASPKTRVGALLEALDRLNKQSFLIGHATLHTAGQGFAMAFQAGGPHAQDRGLEAVAVAWNEMTSTASQSLWEKPQGKNAPLRIEKHWQLVPRGIALTIGCNTFPTWNGYPGIFASLATGNPVIIKPHPKAILPLALSVKVLREVFDEAGLPQDAVLLAADEPGQEITQALVKHPDVAMIDYTGSNAFADWIRQHAGDALVFTEEAGVNSVAITGTNDFAGMCANLAFSLSLYSGQMCTSPQNLYIPRDGIDTDDGHKSFDDVAQGIASAIDTLLDDPERAAGICGTIVNPATLERIDRARGFGKVLRDSGEVGTGRGRTATPLMVVVAERDGPHNGECFGPVSFVVPCDSAEDAIARASALAKQKGAITAALYATDDRLIQQAVPAYALAGVNLSVNLTGNIFVNQAAAFSDFHVTGANPAGNASLTDTAFVASRFCRVMIRWPQKAL